MSWLSIMLHCGLTQAKDAPSRRDLRLAAGGAVGGLPRGPAHRVRLRARRSFALSPGVYFTPLLLAAPAARPGWRPPGRRRRAMADRWKIEAVRPPAPRDRVSGSPAARRAPASGMWSSWAAGRARNGRKASRGAPAGGRWPPRRPRLDLRHEMDEASEHLISDSDRHWPSEPRARLRRQPPGGPELG